MKVHTFSSELWLPRARESVYLFFADAHNLEAITPPWLGFRILTAGPIDMKVGARIDYRLHVHGLPLNWQTVITAWEPPFRFVDEQRRGPYRKWIHTHTFEEKDGGTLCRDEVLYAVPGGSLVNWLFIRRDVETIFKFRSTALRQLFPGR